MITTLRSVYSAQTQFRHRGIADAAAYSGPGAALNCGAALVPGDPDTVMSGAIASGINGRDGNLWRSVQQ